MTVVSPPRSGNDGPPRSSTAGAAATSRVVAVDVARGLVMLMSVSAGFGLGTLSDDPTWGRVDRWFHHVPWEGAVAWDMIQPAFLVLAGMSMTFAYTRRRQRGSTLRGDLTHVLKRSAKLIALSQVLVWISRGEAQPQLIDALSQLALVSIVVFLVMRRPMIVQIAVGVGALVVHTLLHIAFPGPDGTWSTQRPVGVAIDQLIFRWDYYDGVYSTLNALPSIVWVLVGSWVGTMLMSSLPIAVRLRRLGVGGAGALGAGLVLTRWMPSIKQLCTASFVLISLGIVLLMFCAIYALTDVVGVAKPVWPLTVIGRNTLLVYSIDMVLLWWIDSSVAVFTGRFKFIGLFGSAVQALAVSFMVWLVCLWLYRRQIVIKM